MDNDDAVKITDFEISSLLDKHKTMMANHDWDMYLFSKKENWACLDAWCSLFISLAKITVSAKYDRPLLMMNGGYFFSQSLSSVSSNFSLDELIAVR